MVHGSVIRLRLLEEQMLGHHEKLCLQHTTLYCWVRWLVLGIQLRLPVYAYKMLASRTKAT